MECPKEHEGLPVVCLYEEGWEQKIRNFLEENQSFVLIGPETSLKKFKELLEDTMLVDIEKREEHTARAVLSNVTIVIGSIGLAIIARLYEWFGYKWFRNLEIELGKVFTGFAYLIRNNYLEDIGKRYRKRKKPGPTSGRSSQYSFHWTTVKNKRALVCRIR